MASFSKYKTKDGQKWMFKILVGTHPVTGRPKQTTRRGFQTKKEAQAAAAKMEAEIKGGTFVRESDITFIDFVPVWFKYYKRLVKKSTVETRVTGVKILAPFLGQIKIKNIHKRMYIDVLHELFDQGKSDNTIKMIHATASLIFKFALAEGYVQQNPTLDIDFRFLKQRETELKEDEKFLEKEDLATFLRHAKENHYPQDYPMFLTLAFTGLRRGELAVLKWDDIDFEEQTISVTKTYYSETKRGNDVTPSPPKTPKAIREIDVDHFVIEELRKLKLWQREFKMQYRQTYKEFGYVFINTHFYPGYPIDPYRVYEHMIEILDNMEYPAKLSPHSLRHTHASLCIEAGIELRDISDRLGHEDMSTLTKIYAHTTKGQRKKVARKFNDMMQKVRQEISF